MSYKVPGGKPHGQELHARVLANPLKISFLSYVHQEHKTRRASLENCMTAKHTDLSLHRLSL